VERTVHCKKGVMQTATASSPSSSRLQCPPTSERFGIEGLTGVHTALVTLSPQFVAALKSIAPKKRRSKVPLVILLGIAAVLFALGMDKSTREFAMSRARARGIGVVTRNPAPPPVAVVATAPATPVVAVPTVQRPTVLVDDPTPAPSVDSRKAAKKPVAKPSRKIPGAAALKSGAGLVS
jgi:hypothetical protein